MTCFTTCLLFSFIIFTLTAGSTSNNISRLCAYNNNVKSRYLQTGQNVSISCLFPDTENFIFTFALRLYKDPEFGIRLYRILYYKYSNETGFVMRKTTFAAKGIEVFKTTRSNYTTITLQFKMNDNLTGLYTCYYENPPDEFIQVETMISDYYIASSNDIRYAIFTWKKYSYSNKGPLACYPYGRPDQICKNSTSTIMAASCGFLSINKNRVCGDALGNTWIPPIEDRSGQVPECLETYIMKRLNPVKKLPVLPLLPSQNATSNSIQQRIAFIHIWVWIDTGTLLLIWVLLTVLQWQLLRKDPSCCVYPLKSTRYFLLPKTFKR
ncbi:membrane protein A25 [Saimiriine betaherpesvirus 4]|uniref:Membrane protein A25 n=1 Tax=Saimiriine betaherpesvirus 4 TaxID=1535247 RepID=G8XT30_9BETA|nr:membrane protein A25 [Saimiriine betaherpesvirus 4]AEV80976.1 membrane protein A25 [Saimiriine betaherpesvirus 4]